MRDEDDWSYDREECCCKYPCQCGIGAEEHIHRCLWAALDLGHCDETDDRSLCQCPWST